MHQREPEAAADADLLGGEERIEHALEDLGADAAARIRDFENQVFARRDRADRSRARRLEAHALERHPQQSALRHGLHGIAGEVHHDLVHLRRIAQHCRAPGAQVGAHANASRQVARQEIERFAHHRLDVHGDALAHPAAAEGQDAVDQGAAPFAGGHDAVEIALQPRAFLRAALRHLAVAEDGAEDVVEIVRDATGERAHRLEPLRAAQLPLHLSQLLLGVPALGHVLHEAHHARRLAGAVEEHPAPGLQPVH